MLARLAHRATQAALWLDGPIALGWRGEPGVADRPATGWPGRPPAAGPVLAADARLDNRGELVRELCPARPAASDPELMLAAYARWGETCPARLLGDFSLAFWDPERHRLVCARDRIGVKPFYYFASDRLFAFASEIQSLLSLPEVPRRLNETRIIDYLIPCFEDKVATFYEGILRLPPGHVLVVEGGKIRLHAYWLLDPTRQLRLGSDEEYADAFRELFTEAVRCRTRGSARVGALLSGGLDSSAIACTATRLLAAEDRGPLPTFSVVFDRVPQCDERCFIGQVLEQGGFAPSFVAGDGRGPLDGLEMMLEDEPFYTPNLFLHWAMYNAARSRGIGILLDGFDGDIVVSHGLPALAEHLRGGRWGRLARESAALSDILGRPVWSILRAYALPALCPQPIRVLRRQLRAGGWQRELQRLLSPGFRKRVDVAGRVRLLHGLCPSPPRNCREKHHADLSQGLLSFALEVVDRAAAALGVVPRYPFFDSRLVEFCLALPSDQKLDGGWTRAVLRRSMSGILPRGIQWRRGKSDLFPNFRHVLGTFERQQVQQLLTQDPGPLGAYLDRAALRRIHERYCASNEPVATLNLWKVFTLGLWLKRFCDYREGGLKPSRRLAGSSPAMPDRSFKSFTEVTI